MPMKELLECKHPMAWIEFEKGLIDEVLESTPTLSLKESSYVYLLTFGFRGSLQESSL